MISSQAVNFLIVTTNEHKLSEIRGILSGLTITLDGLERHPGIEKPEETGHSFAENARLKARHYAERTDRICIAEDSGLEIDALDGAPGVFSARFNGGSYPQKFAAIYKQLLDQGTVNSAARFWCAVAVAERSKITFEATGTIEGQIATSPSGDAGFGYDPIFFYPPYGRTLAEVSDKEKDAVSHRGKAFRTLRAYLEAMV